MNAKTSEPREAIRHIGTNALPFFLRMLRAKDSTLKLELMNLADRQDYIHFHFSSAEEEHLKAFQGFCCLSDLATDSVPALKEIYYHSSSESSKEYANSALMVLYPASAAAIPYWVPIQQRAAWFTLPES